MTTIEGGFQHQELLPSRRRAPAVCSSSTTGEGANSRAANAGDSSTMRGMRRLSKRKSKGPPVNITNGRRFVWKSVALVFVLATILLCDHTSRAFSTPSSFIVITSTRPSRAMMTLPRRAQPTTLVVGRLSSFPAAAAAAAVTSSAAAAAKIRRYSSTIICHLVSEDDVLEAVEKAEELWSQALEARKTANALSDRAEEEAEAAAATSKEIDNLFQVQKASSEPITMQQLAKADAAAKNNLDAGSMVNKALQALEEAERLEALAEEALRRSEEILEQHAVDFPDSPFAQ